MSNKNKKFAAAFTLIEVMAAILIVTIVIAGGSFLFITGRGQISLQKHYRVATQLAVQRLEALKAAPYASVTIGETEENVDLEDVDYGRVTNTVNAGTYKEVTVTVSWNQGANAHNVSMVTCIAP